jgi:predicted amidohydrolase YtcJ
LAADLALLDGNVRTMNPAQPTAQAVAVKAGKIFKVGTNQEINKLVGKTTKVLKLDGKTVLPGLIDTHIHVADYGRMLMWLDLTEVRSIADLKAMLKQKAAQTQAGKWIIGQGWNETRLKRLPTTAEGKVGTKPASNVCLLPLIWMRQRKTTPWCFTVKQRWSVLPTAKHSRWLA